MKAINWYELLFYGPFQAGREAKYEANCFVSCDYRKVTQLLCSYNSSIYHSSTCLISKILVFLFLIFIYYIN